MLDYIHTIPFSQTILFLVLGALLHFVSGIIGNYVIPLKRVKSAKISKLWLRIQIITWAVYSLLFYTSLFWANKYLTLIITIIVLGLGWNYWINIFAGVLIKYNNHPKPGDLIKTDLVSGKITAIKMAHSEIKNNKGEFVIIPNEKLKGAVLKYQQKKSLTKKHTFIINNDNIKTYDAALRLVINCPYLCANQKIKIGKTPAGSYQVIASPLDSSFIDRIDVYFSEN